jgi:hypothetical protein
MNGVSNNAAQDVATDLAVRPVPHRSHVDQVMVLGLAKALLHHVPVQADPVLTLTFRPPHNTFFAQE